MRAWGSSLHRDAELTLHSSRVRVRISWQGTALADAVREDHAHIATLLRSRQGELLFDEAKASGDLCEYARRGDVKTVQMLLAAGCSANSSDYDRRTALHLAASTGNKSVVEALLADTSVDVNFKDRWGGTALVDAIREQHTHVADLLRQKGGRE